MGTDVHDLINAIVARDLHASKAEADTRRSNAAWSARRSSGLRRLTGSASNKSWWT
jgi:hypothetical protein